MNEATLQSLVMATARGHGLLLHHCADARRCRGDRGLPDLIIAGEHGFMMPEIKDEIGQTSAYQDLWLWHLTRAGIVAPIWRPADWDSGLIHLTLAHLAGKDLAA